MLLKTSVLPDFFFFFPDPTAFGSFKVMIKLLKNGALSVGNIIFFAL